MGEARLARGRRIGRMRVGRARRVQVVWGWLERAPDRNRGVKARRGEACLARGRRVNRMRVGRARPLP